MPKNTVRVEILRPTRCDIREHGTEDAHVVDVAPGEVYELTLDAAEQMFHSVAAKVTDKPVKNRFNTKPADPKTVVTTEAPKGPVTATGNPAVVPSVKK